MYKDFLKGESKTFEGRYGAEEYISMAENRLPGTVAIRPLGSSRPRIHTTACSCGSMISGHRFALVRMAAFSVETRSAGRNSARSPGWKT